MLRLGKNYYFTREYFSSELIYDTTLDALKRWELYTGMQMLRGYKESNYENISIMNECMFAPSISPIHFNGTNMRARLFQ